MINTAIFFNHIMIIFFISLRQKIFGKIGVDFDKTIYQHFEKFYCDSFEDIALNFIKKGGKNIFYPSSVALDDNVKGLEEYKIAKEKGELICSKIKKEFNINVLFKRLPRILTDQTLTLLPVKSLNPLNAAIEIAHQILKSQK